MHVFKTILSFIQTFWDINPLPFRKPGNQGADADHWLIRFLQLTILSDVMILIVALFLAPFMHLQAFFVVVGFIAGAIVAISVGLYWAKTGQTIRAGLSYYWVSALTGTLGVMLIPTAFPVAVVTALLSMIASLPYLRLRQLRWMLPLTMILVPIQALLAYYSRLFMNTIPLSDSIVAVFTTYCVGLGLLFLRQYHWRLTKVYASLEATVEERTRELQDRELRFRIVSEMTSDFVFEIDLHSPLAYTEQIGELLSNLTGYPIEVVSVFKNWTNIIHPEDLQQAREYLYQISIMSEHRVEIRIYGSDGEIRWLRFYSRTIFDPGTNQPRQLIGAVQDVSERRSYEEQIRQLAFFDPLTGLANRRLFNQRIQDALAQSSSEEPLSIIFMDIDRFKAINDTLGHEVGDLLLLQVGQRLMRCTRLSDLLARLGGDEFAIVLPDTSAEDAHLIATRILSEFDLSFIINTHPLRVSTSVGIASAPEHGTTINALMQHADIAMYHAKHRGIGVQVYRPILFSYSQERLELESELRQALEGDELQLFCQPFLNLRTGKITAAEVLVRWQHPRRGLLPPSDFIPLAEECGLIGAIDRWVIKVAFDFSLQASRAGEQVRISINLSMQSLQDADLLTFVREQLLRSGADPSMILIEVTESMVMDDLEQTMHTLRQLKSMNMAIALDDFGSGHTSLNRLTQLPVDILKLDSSFTHRLQDSVKDREIMQAFIMLAHNLELDVVVEGVETAEQLRWLGSLGADYAQGYYVSHPIAIEGFLDMLECINYTERSA